MTVPAPQPKTASPGLRQVVRQLPRWLHDHTLTAVITAVVGGLFGYISNVWLIAVRYEGTQVPSGSPTTSNGSFFQGALFWALFSAVIFGVAGYWQAVGTSKFLAGLRGLPRALAGLVRGDRAAYVHLLWGAAVSMLAAVVLSPSVGAVLAIGLLAVVPGVIGSILSSGIHQIWSSLVRRIAPTRHQKVTGSTGMTVGLLGSAAALLVAFFVAQTWVKLMLAGVCAVLAILIATFGRPAAAAAMILLLGVAAGAYQLTDATPAFADDGGWTECKGTPWLDCDGSKAVLVNSAIGAAVAAVGSVIGTFAGWLSGAFSGFTGGGPPGGGPFGESPPGAGPPAPPAETAPSTGLPGLPPLPGLGPVTLGAPLPPGPEAATGEPGAGTEGEPARKPAAGPPEAPPGPGGDRIPVDASIRARLHQIDLETPDPRNPAYGQIQDLIAGIDPTKGLTPQQLATLQQLEGQHDAAYQANVQKLNVERQAIADKGMVDLVDKMQKGRKEEQEYTEYIKTLNRIENRTNVLNNLIGKLPPSQQEAANRVLTKIQEGPPGTDKEGQIRNLTSVVFQQAQGKAEAAAAAAEGDIADLDALAATAKQAAAQVALTAVGGAAVAVGLATAAQISAISLGAGVVRGASAGYAQGGAPGAMWGVTKATMPVNTVQATVDLAHGKGSLVDVAIGVVQDVGNVATLVAVGAGLRNIFPGAAPPVPKPAVPGTAAPGAPAVPAGTAGARAGATGGAGPKPPGPPTPGAAPQAVSKTLGKEGITDVEEFLKGINSNPSPQGLGYTKQGLFQHHEMPPVYDPVRKVWRSDPNYAKPVAQQAPDTKLTNCGNTTIATDAKLAGNPLPPAPPSSGMTAGLMEELFNSQFTKVQSKQTINSTLQVAGPGSRGVIFARNQMAPPPGSPPGTPSVQTWHFFNVVNDGGVVKYLDGQSGTPANFQGLTELFFMKTG
ncbi:toxin glutamine deamidase domain-containing protein [Streptomyces wedmorensis]